MKYTGLSTEQVIELQDKYGTNSLPSKEGFSVLNIFFRQFLSPLIYVLFVTSIISLLFKEYVDFVLIWGVILLNSFMGFIQEFKAKKTLQALQKIVRPLCTVIREGKRTRVESINLVPGDVVLISSGDTIPADGLIVENVNLLVKEAILTGEQEAVSKVAGKDEVYMGTTVISGRGILKVLNTGTRTKIGEIGLSLYNIKEEDTPLQKSLKKFSKQLGLLIIVVSLVIFVIGVLKGEDVWYMVRMAVILSVAAIPEGLPVSVTVILSLGVKRILRRKGLVKKVVSVEALGATTVICTDKTGTLTEGNMKVVKHHFKDNQRAVQVITLTNERKSNIELALWDFVIKNNYSIVEHTESVSTRIFEEPFNSEKKFTFTVSEIDKKPLASLIGAPEVIMSFCEISPQDRQEELMRVDKWASEGLRIMSLCYKENGDLMKKENFTYLGSLAIEDPIRKEALPTFERAKRAGIKIKIVTGDYLKTAVKIASQLGFTVNHNNVIEGKVLEKISNKKLNAIVNDIVIFARVTPGQKLRIVKALQHNGEVVAMTGDGVNDAEALKKADLGVVMGDSADTAKEAGDLILLDNNFKTIVAACEEGRLIYQNIKQVVAYMLSNSFVEVVLILGSIIINAPFPLTVIQILWVHLICDGPPDIVLGFENNRKGLLDEKPRKMNKDRILDGYLKFLVGFISVFVGLATLIIFNKVLKDSGSTTLAQTVAFATVGSVDLLYIFAYKDLKNSIFGMHGFFKNKYLLLAVAYGFILLFGAIYIPQLNRFLQIVPIMPIHWVYVFMVAILATLSVELAKFVHKWNKNR